MLLKSAEASNQEQEGKKLYMNRHNLVVILNWALKRKLDFPFFFSAPPLPRPGKRRSTSSPNTHLAAPDGATPAGHCSHSLKGSFIKQHS